MDWHSFVLLAFKTDRQSTIWLRRDDLISADATDEAWHTLEEKIRWLKCFDFPQNPPVAAARWRSWKGAFVGWDSTLIMSLLTRGYICCMKSLFILLHCEQCYFFMLNMKHRDKLAIMRLTTDERCHAGKYEHLEFRAQYPLCLIHLLNMCVDLSHNQLIGFKLWVMQMHSRAAPACFSLYWLGFKSGPGWNWAVKDC